MIGASAVTSSPIALVHSGTMALTAAISSSGRGSGRLRMKACLKWRVTACGCATAPCGWRAGLCDIAPSCEFHSKWSPIRQKNVIKTGIPNNKFVGLRERNPSPTPPWTESIRVSAGDLSVVYDAHTRRKKERDANPALNLNVEDCLCCLASTPPLACRRLLGRHRTLSQAREVLRRRRTLMVPASVTKTCTVRFDNNKYSALSTAVGRSVEIQPHADRIVIREDGAIVGEHSRSFGRNNLRSSWHSVRKSGALRNGAQGGGLILQGFSLGHVLLRQVDVLPFCRDRNRQRVARRIYHPILSAMGFAPSARCDSTTILGAVERGRPVGRGPCSCRPDRHPPRWHDRWGASRSFCRNEVIYDPWHNLPLVV